MNSIIVTLFLLLAAPAASRSAEPPLPEASPDSALALKLEALGGASLTLEEALRLSSEGSTAVREASAALLAAEAAVRREKGEFDPELFFDLTKASTDAPTASPFSGADVLETRETRGSAGARMRLPLGTEIEASLRGARTETNSSFAALNPEYTSTGALMLRQPLLAGFGPSARGTLTAAERARDAARARYRDAVLGVEADVEATYWDLYAAERDLAALEAIRDRAAALLREAELRAKAGIVGPNQVANARVFLAEQDLGVLDGEERLGEASDRLATLIGSRPSRGEARFHPVEDPPRYDTAVPVDTLVATTLRSNHALAASRADLEEMKALARAAGWDALPTLDLVGTLDAAGLAGEARDLVIFGDTLRVDREGNLGDTWNQVAGFDYPGWSVGVELTWPIGARPGRGERDRLRAQVEAAEARHEALARSLEESSRAAHRELVNGARRMAAAREGIDASREQVRIGVIEYRNGRSTAFELVRLGADLAAAERRYSEALVRTAQAAAALRRLTSGTWPDRIPR